MDDPVEIMRAATDKSAAYQLLFDAFTARNPEADLLEPDWPAHLEREWQEWMVALERQYPQ